MSLSGDSLSIITKYIYIQDVYNIYLMGNRLMIHKMRNYKIYLTDHKIFNTQINALNINCYALDINESRQTIITSLCPKIRFLKMNGYRIKDKKELPFLESIKSYFFQDQSLENISVRELPKNLLYLNLSSVAKLTDACIKDLPRSLTYLKLSNPDFTDLCIPDLPKNLTSFELLYNNKLTDYAISYLPRDLLHLNLSSTIQLTDTCIKYLPPYLLTLNLAYNYNLSDACIQDPNTLINLNLQHCYKLTSECLKYLPRSLLYLNLSYNKSITDHVIENILIRVEKGILFPPSLIELKLHYKILITEKYMKDTFLPYIRVKLFKKRNLSNLLPVSLKYLYLDNTSNSYLKEEYAKKLLYYSLENI
jgi:hypothetical protein